MPKPVIKEIRPKLDLSFLSDNSDDDVIKEHSNESDNDDDLQLKVHSKEENKLLDDF